MYVHPDSPATGAAWMAGSVSFSLLKLTNHLESAADQVRVTWHVIGTSNVTIGRTPFSNRNNSQFLKEIIFGGLCRRSTTIMLRDSAFWRHRKIERRPCCWRFLYILLLSYVLTAMIRLCLSTFLVTNSFVLTFSSFILQNKLSHYHIFVMYYLHRSYS